MSCDRRPAGVERSLRGGDPRALLQQPPSGESLVWLVAALGGGRIERVELMPGASTAAMHRVTVHRRSGAAVRVVLRQYVRPDLLAAEPWLAGDELRALAVVHGHGLPTPEPLAGDPTGGEAGVPTVVMSELPGRHVWEPRRAHDWVRRLAETAAAIHAVTRPPDARIRPYAGYRQRSYEPPAWARRQDVWRRAVDVFHEPVPNGDRHAPRLIHRDFHPGNLLWQRGRLTGIVDWAATSLGPTDVDIGHCRANFLLYAPHLADDLAAAWRDVSGVTYDRWADVAAIVGMLDDLRARPPSPRARDALEDALGHAVADRRP